MYVHMKNLLTKELCFFKMYHYVINNSDKQLFHEYKNVTLLEFYYLNMEWLVLSRGLCCGYCVASFRLRNNSGTNEQLKRYAENQDQTIIFQMKKIQRGR